MEGITLEQVFSLLNRIGSSLLKSDLTKHEFQKKVLEMKASQLNELVGDITQLIISRARMSAASAGSIIASRLRPDLIELVPVTVDYDRALEEMLAPYPHNTILETIPPSSKTSKVSSKMYLVRIFKPAPIGYPHATVEAAIANEGFVPAGVLELASLAPYSDELKRAGVNVVIALDQAFQDGLGNSYVSAYQPGYPSKKFPFQGHFYQYNLMEFAGGMWYLVFASPKQG